jgi:acetylornithine deacetylase/succinyl-diaminopimelate desuccinylase-like protein
MDNKALTQFIADRWDNDIVGQLVEYIKIPNKSPMFDANWQANGFMEQATQQFANWAKAQDIAGMHVEIVRLGDRTPLILVEIDGEGDDCVLMYGHLDKQPEMTGWDEDLGPWKPVIKGDKLYGRGGADDGYALFGSLTAIAALKQQNISHSRVVIMIEACEESGSYDLPHYVDHLAERIGRPSLVVCLDSGCANYDQLWCTTSLRGLAGGNLRVDVLTEGVHSGDASGIVPSSFRILRQLLSRIDNQDTGEVTLDELQVNIPEQRLQQAMRAAEVLGEDVFDKFPFMPGMKPMNSDLGELILNRTWRPSLSITGIDGIPSLNDAGNVLRPFTAVKLSLRLPPMLEPDAAGNFLKKTLESNPPFGAKVSFELEKASTGWNAPELAPWLETAIENASQASFGAPAMYMGEGGTIPFMGMLGEKFPGAQFMITGVLGPHSNAHGPNEFLHIPTGKRVTESVAYVVAAHFEASQQGLTQGVAVHDGQAQFGEHGCC